MPDGTLQRSYGKVFDRIAGAYDRHRPGYPEPLIDLACRGAGLAPGEPVLEVGCGTGQLTASLLCRGLHVTAVEPGPRLAALARQRLQGAGELELVEARFEDSRLPREQFRAVFSASAIHWVDPELGWQRAAEALLPGGTLALLQYFGLHRPDGADDRQELLRRISEIAPAAAAGWPRYRELETMLAGVRERRRNVSEAWAWLGGHELARGYVAQLFDDAQIFAAPSLMEHTAAELNDALSTMSFWSRLLAEQREAIKSANLNLQEELGRPIRSSTAACLVVARRSSPR